MRGSTFDLDAAAGGAAQHRQSEDQKGTDEIREAAAELKGAGAIVSMEFTGFVEGDKLARGHHDVIVCDGFAGNIALKTAEGTARFVGDLLKRAFTSSVRSKVGFLISRPATRAAARSSRPQQA